VIPVIEFPSLQLLKPEMMNPRNVFHILLLHGLITFLDFENPETKDPSPLVFANAEMTKPDRSAKS
jgi:hypothetical protein